MPYGYSGRILHVDLTEGRLEYEEPPEVFYRKYMGGSALGMYYALKLIPRLPGFSKSGIASIYSLTLGN